MIEGVALGVTVSGSVATGGLWWWVRSGLPWWLGGPEGAPPEDRFPHWLDGKEVPPQS